MEEPNVATVILAGGKGTRLFPLTMHHCKPAVAYAGRYRLIDVPISNSIHSGFFKIFVLGQYLTSELQHHISQTYRFGMFLNGAIDFITPQENEKGEKEWFEGTADAVRKSLPTLLKSDADYFLILSGDHLYNIDLREMVRQTIDRNADITIASTLVHYTEGERFGILGIDAEGRIEQFIEKPKEEEARKKLHLKEPFFQLRKRNVPEEPHLLASMGIYVFKRNVMIRLLRSNPKMDFGRDILSSAIEKYNTHAFVYEGYWEDIGTVESYFYANLLLTSGKEGINLYDEERPIYTRSSFLPGPKITSANIRASILCEGSCIEAAEIDHCIVGMRSHIRAGTLVRSSVLSGNHFYLPPAQEEIPVESKFYIGENCRIERAIIDENVRIGNNVSLVNETGMQHFDGNGVYIRDGIIIVAAGTVLQDHFSL